MKYQGNMVASKDHNNFPVFDSKDMEICNLADKELKITVLETPNELQKHKKKNSLKPVKNTQTKWEV